MRPYRLISNNILQIPRKTIYLDNAIRIDKLWLRGLTYTIEILSGFRKLTPRIKAGILKRLHMRYKHLKGTDTIIYTNSKMWFEFMINNNLLPATGNDANLSIPETLVRYLNQYAGRSKTDGQLIE